MHIIVSNTIINNKTWYIFYGIFKDVWAEMWKKSGLKYFRAENFTFLFYSNYRFVCFFEWRNRTFSPILHHVHITVSAEWFNLASLHQITETWMWPLNPPSCHVMPINSGWFSDSFFWEWKKGFWKEELPWMGLVRSSWKPFCKGFLMKAEEVSSSQDKWIDSWTTTKKSHWLPLKFCILLKKCFTF